MTTAVFGPVGTRPRQHFMESVASTPNLTLFRHLVWMLCHGPRPRRAERREKVVSLLKEAGDPQRYIGQLLETCIHEGGPEGLDIAIDILSQTGAVTVEYLVGFATQDSSRWSDAGQRNRSSDDVWYVLARAVAKSDLDELNIKIPLLLFGLDKGTPSIREASVHALGDVGSESARLLLENAMQDQDPLVRESASEVLADLEV